MSTLDDLRALRSMLPDVALHHDKDSITSALAPLCLELAPGDGDDAITIWLQNSYWISWRPAAVTAEGHSSWGMAVPPSWAELERLLNSDEQEFADWQAMSLEDIIDGPGSPIIFYTVWVTLSRSKGDAKLPATPKVLRGTDPLELLQESLRWFRHETGLPLKPVMLVPMPHESGVRIDQAAAGE